MAEYSRRLFVHHMLSLGAVSYGLASAVNGWGAPRESRLSRLLRSLASPVLLAGDSKTAYRDPAAVYHNGWFYLFYTLVKTGLDGIPYSFVAFSKSQELRHWSQPTIITEKSRELDCGSPGDIVRLGDKWMLCMQTYPRPDGQRFGDANSRIWTMSSTDLEHWGKPELLRVGGPDVSAKDMGRTIDPFLLEDKDDPDVWWCFYKKNGIKLSRSTDLMKTWMPVGDVCSGENPSVIVDHHEYVLFYSPANGIGIKRSVDLKLWRDEGLLTLGQQQWPWAAGRLTAGFVLDLRKVPEVGRALMFFHGSRYPEEDARGGFDSFASLGIAWSSDLRRWYWPGGGKRTPTSLGSKQLTVSAAAIANGAPRGDGTYEL
jgi:hypothetical protein